jgi:hypothetical protein
LRDGDDAEDDPAAAPTKGAQTYMTWEAHAERGGTVMEFLAQSDVVKRAEMTAPPLAHCATLEKPI